MNVIANVVRNNVGVDSHVVIVDVFISVSKVFGFDVIT